MEKWKGRVQRTCVFLVILAVILRLGGSSVAGMTPEGQRDLVAFMLYLQTGVAVHPGDPTETVPEPGPTTPPEQTVPVTEPSVPHLTFSRQEGEGLSVKYGGDYRPDIPGLLTEPVELDFSGEEPRILILHTHATESYTQEPGWEYKPSGNYRTLDEQYNMLRVGEAMARILNDAGILTIHDRTLHDYPSYNSSYSRALETIQYYLERYPSIEMVLDVHRDAIEDYEGNQLTTCATVLGRSSARVMLVVGTDEGGLYHPHWQRNLSWALKLQAQMDRLYPGLSRTLSLRQERFNAHATAGSLLVEIGTAGDTLQDALAAGESFAHTLAQTILGLGLDKGGDS